jgi:predicted nuclease with RNAse H fold
VPGVLGVDVSLGRGLDVVLMEERVVKEAWSRLGPGQLVELIQAHDPMAVAVDAPPRPGLGLLRDQSERARLPVPPAAGRHLYRRVAEYELSRRGIGSHQTHFDETRLFSWMTAGFETFRAVEAAGFPPYLGEGRTGRTALEVFPYASYVALSGCLSPGRRWRAAWRRTILEEAGVQGISDDAVIDVLDAACAALTAERFIDGRGSFVGDAREGVIVLPVPRLEDHYRRCVSPDGPVHAVAARAAARLCECGCGRAVRRRFLPGHAAKLRSRLLSAARAGEDARRHLARLGWSDLLRESTGSSPPSSEEHA